MTPREFHNARLYLNLTQEELASKLGVTSTSVSRYECGQRDISDTVAILLRLLVEQHHPRKSDEVRSGIHALR